MTEIMYTWNDFDKDIDFLVQQITYSNWIPDYIVGVKRGGLIPAVKISQLLRKPLMIMSCQLRDGIDNQINLLEVEHIDKDSKIIIVDDICDSGKTFETITKVIAHHAYVKYLALYYNTSQDFKIDYAANLIDRTRDNRWIIFPWEKK